MGSIGRSPSVRAARSVGDDRDVAYKSRRPIPDRTTLEWGCPVIQTLCLGERIEIHVGAQTASLFRQRGDSPVKRLSRSSMNTDG